MSHLWPDAEDLLYIKSEHTGPKARVRDAGILVAAAGRPHAFLIDRFTYLPPLDQASALLHSIVCWRPLDVWNGGLAWGAARVFLAMAGYRLAMPAQDRMQLVADLEDRRVDSVAEVSERLAPHVEVAY